MLKPLPLSLFLVFSLFMSFMLGAHANERRGRWHHHDHEIFRNGRVMDLGSVRMGDRGRGMDADVIEIRNRNTECNLTHIRLSARDAVVVQHAVVEYRNGARDSLDLSDVEDRRRDRDRNALVLRAGESSDWLDIDDVLDGRSSGRCVERIFLYGDDFDRRGTGRRRGGRDRRDGAIVNMEGFVKQMRRPDPGPGPGHGHREPRVELLGSTQISLLLDNDLVPVNECGIDDIKLTVRDLDAHIEKIQLFYRDGGSESVSEARGFYRADSSTEWIDLRGHRRRCITHIKVVGQGFGIFRTARVEIYGRR
jgi:hypothetical protein